MSAIRESAARLEVTRCQRALDKGSPAPFWIQRLTRAAEECEEAARILREQLERMEGGHA